mgnify:CR=1 FL=1
MDLVDVSAATRAAGLQAQLNSQAAANAGLVQLNNRLLTEVQQKDLRLQEASNRLRDRLAEVARLRNQVFYTAPENISEIQDRN